VNPKGKKDAEDKFELYDLASDPKETNNLIVERPAIADELKSKWKAWNQSVDDSVAGRDYSEGQVLEQPERRFWRDDPGYAPYAENWMKELRAVSKP